MLKPHAVQVYMLTHFPSRRLQNCPDEKPHSICAKQPEARFRTEYGRANRTICPVVLYGYPNNLLALEFKHPVEEGRLAMRQENISISTCVGGALIDKIDGQKA